ncbi:hypothetical protein D1BOALGB6SA_5375 [Olavius sp. associated proteobacterium Delta 1]|nr:hypothetical protein D1BOALGB6SA_5375 [Olavius sp. associated proteobacterium Delta 1]
MKSFKVLKRGTVNVELLIQAIIYNDNEYYSFIITILCK